MSFWIATDHWKNQALFRSMEISAPCLIVWRGAGNGLNINSCLFDEASIKVSLLWGSEASRLVNSCPGKAVHPNPTWTKGPELGTLPDLILRSSSSTCSSVFLSRHLLYNKLVHFSVSLNSVSCSSRWLNPRRGLWETLVYSQLVRNMGGNRNLWEVSWVGGQPCGTEPLTHGVCTNSG